MSNSQKLEKFKNIKQTYLININRSIKIFSHSNFQITKEFVTYLKFHKNLINHFPKLQNNHFK